MAKNNKGQGKKYSTIGGQALIEGVMMRGKACMALAVRNPEGDILTETERIKPRRKIKRIPVLRGVVSFFSSLVLGVSTITRSAQVSAGEDEQISKGAMAISVIFALALSVGLFFFLPGLVSAAFYNNIFKSVLLKSLVSGAIRITLFVGYLFLVSLLKDVRRTFMYHGAEHKTINCYEKGLDLTVENAKTCSTRHNRCGTTFMFLVMLISILVFAFADWGLYRFVGLKDGLLKDLTFMGIKLALLPLVAGLSYEVLFLFAKMPDNILSKILRAPGLALQRLTTKEPDEDMLKVAITSFCIVMEMDQNPLIPTKKFNQILVKDALKECEARLIELGAEPVEAVWLVCFCLNCKRAELNLFKHISYNDYKKLKELLKKREEMPLDYVLGLSCFYGYDVRVDKSVLIPRPETELLAEAAVKLIGDKELSVLDLCTGSGCIALALAKETKARITASDISACALELARQNLNGLNVEIVEGDLFADLGKRAFDLIVCNPPYIASGEICLLQREVLCEPKIALDGGADGLEFYRRISLDAKNYLNQGGVILLEVGVNQANLVKDLFSGNGFKVQTIKDLNGIERIVKASL